MRRALALLCLALGLPGSALAEGITVRSLDELVKPADLIARVTIIHERADSTWTWRTPYRRIAFAHVTDALKGTVRNHVILLYHDNGQACPNMKYRPREDVLLFALKSRRGRGYESMFWATGSMCVRAGRVTHDLFPGVAAYQDVRTQVLQLLANSGLR